MQENISAALAWMLWDGKGHPQGFHIRTRYNRVTV